jgi:hypothetical protein
VNEFLRKLARITRWMSRPIAGRRWLPLWALIRYRGRKSGRAYESPIVVRPIADGFVIPLPFDGAQWVRNVLAQGGATLRWKATDIELTNPVIVDVLTAGPAFSGLQRRLLRV